jgi:hypothetical protein
VYVAREAGASLAVTLPVELVRLFGHVLMGGITGFGVGMFKRHPAGHSWIAIAAGCVAGGIGIHFLWDYVALTGAMFGETGATTAFSIGLLVLTVGAYGALVVAGSRSSRQKFAPGSAERVWRPRRRG